MSGDPIPWKSFQLYFPQIDPWGPNPNAPPGQDIIDVFTYTDAVALMHQPTDALQTALYPINPTLYPNDSTQKSREMSAHAVYASFFQIVDAPFLYGSAWSKQDDQNHALLAVISKQLNQREFGGRNSVGKTVRLNGSIYRVVGVLDQWHPQPQFYDLANSVAFGAADDLFIPFTAAIDQKMSVHGGFACGPSLPAPGFAGTLASSCTWISFMVQLDNADQVSAYTQMLRNYLLEQQRVGRFGWPPKYHLRSLRQWMDLEHVVPPETKMSMVVAMCLLVVCMVNAIGLLLAKFMRRAGEVGVRRAMGARRSAIALQFAVEAVAVGVAGGVVGLLLTGLGMLWMHRQLPPQVAALTRIDASLLVETVLLSVVAAVVASMYPILRASAIALTLAIVCNALFIVGGRVASMHRVTGIDEANIMLLLADIQADLRAIRALPDVADAYESNSISLTGDTLGLGLKKSPDDQGGTIGGLFFADDQTLGTLGVKLIAGRNFNADEITPHTEVGLVQPPVIIISKHAADGLFPAGDALGKQVYFGGGATKPSRIIGIIDRMQSASAGSNSDDFEWNVSLLPYFMTEPARAYVVRAKPGHLQEALKSVPAALYKEDPQRVIPDGEGPQAGVRSFAQIREQAYKADLALAQLMIAISVILLSVTGAGIVGLTSFWVAQRRRQIGVRRALGATRRSIVNYFLTENFLIGCCGVAVGAGLAIGLNLVMITHFEMHRLPAAYVIVGAVVLLMLGQAAVLGPALRASSVSPVEATRGS
uniref:Antimicrobial peptide ABC transporter permease n=1 Tax=Mycena chlorophos TaxID=658473 RepID=A0ABQ0L3T8_MYCCL|nr:antimicrobial peptide ABC transporter permease [Mycena chlorophos]